MVLTESLLGALPGLELVGVEENCTGASHVTATILTVVVSVY